jgi:acetyl esterase/lipase
MPLGYILLALCIAAALIAPTRPRKLGLLAYAFGWIVSEVPQLGLIYLLGTTALMLVEDVSGMAIVIAGIIAVLSVFGLGELARRGMGSSGVVAAALREADVPVSTQRWRNGWLSLVALFPLRPLAVRRIRNLSYGPHREHRLDVYCRRDAHDGPVLLYFHGGGYFMGRKHWEGRALIYRLVTRGWVCISANYRLRPAADFPEHFNDAKRALAWAHEHAAEYGANTDRLVLSGSSAGAHLSTLCALTQNNDSEHGRARVDAVVGLYGYYGRYYGRGPDEALVSTPLALDATTAPPFFLAHGDHDTYVPVEGARALVNHLRAQSPNPVVYAELPGGHHSFDFFHSWRGAAVVDGIEDFLAHFIYSKGPSWAS